MKYSIFFKSVIFLLLVILPNLKKKKTYVFIAPECSYEVYYNDTSKEEMKSCNDFVLYGTVTPNNPITIEILEGTSGDIIVSKGGNPCLSQKRMKFYSIDAKNLKKNFEEVASYVNPKCN